MRLIALGFGALLVVALVVLIFIYFSPKRKAKVETPKYRMLEDDETDSAGSADKNA